MFHSNTSQTTTVPKTTSLLRVALFSAIFVAFSPRSSAQVDAFQGTLGDYLALDDEGVTIGDAVFTNFQMLPLQEGASGFITDFIDVVPLLSDPLSPGFRFEIMDGATAEDFFELRFSFEVSGVFFDSATLTLGTVNVRSDSNAGADALADFSLLDGADGSVGSLFAFAAPGGLNELDARLDFPAVGGMRVELDAVLDGGTEGRSGEIAASIGSVTLQFDRADPQPEFEPVVLRAGFVGATSFFIEFESTPGVAHIVTASADLTEWFPVDVPLIDGDGRTDATGYERVVIDTSAYGEAQFFRIEKSS